MRPRQRLGILHGLAATFLIWGSPFLANKIAIQSLPPDESPQGGREKERTDAKKLVTGTVVGAVTFDYVPGPHWAKGWPEADGPRRGLRHTFTDFPFGRIFAGVLVFGSV